MKTFFTALIAGVTLASTLKANQDDTTEMGTGLVIPEEFEGDLTPAVVPDDGEGEVTPAVVPDDGEGEVTPAVVPDDGEGDLIPPFPEEEMVGQMWSQQSDDQLYAGLSDEAMHFLGHFTGGARMPLQDFLLHETWNTDEETQAFFKSLLDAKASDYLWFRDSTLISSVLWNQFSFVDAAGAEKLEESSLAGILDLFGSAHGVQYAINNYAENHDAGLQFDEFETFIEDIMYDTLRKDKGTHIDVIVDGLFGNLSDAKEDMQTARQIITAVMAKVEALELKFTDLFEPTQ